MCPACGERLARASLGSAPCAAAERKPLPGSHPREAPELPNGGFRSCLDEYQVEGDADPAGSPHPASRGAGPARGTGGPRGAQPESGALGDSAELPAHILGPKSANPSRSERCLGFQSPWPRSLAGAVGRPSPTRDTRGCPGRGKRQLGRNETSASPRFGHLVSALLSSDILNKYKESLALLSSIRLHDRVEPSDFHQSSIK